MRKISLPKVLGPLIEKPNWVIWKWVVNEKGRWTKPPFQSLHPSRHASTTERATWSKFSEAVAAAPNDGGIGFVLKGSGIGAIDIDDCVADNGEFNEAAKELIEKSGSYTEITPSRRGIRIIGFTRGPMIKQEHISLGEGSHAEVYRDCNRFITVTGKAVQNFSTLENIDKLIDDLVKRKHGNAAPKKEVDKSPSGLFHGQVLSWADRRWTVERMVKELRAHPARYAHTKAAHYEQQGRLQEEVIRSLDNAGVTPKREGEYDGWEMLTSREMVEGFTPPDYLVEGILQRGFLYSLTGKTGSGKTSMMLLIAAFVGGYMSGKKYPTLDDHEIERGSVVYFAGENPNDVRIRWIAMAEFMGFDPDEIDIHFVLGRVSLDHDMDRIREKVLEIGGAHLVIVDTAAAYFEGDDENSNAQMSIYAREYLRPLTTLTGTPCVMVACHPAKNVAEDNLQPRGGGAFVAEMDTNLVAIRHAEFAELTWQTKIRGPEFNPIKFEFIEPPVVSKKLVDSKGRKIRTIVAKAVTEEKYDQRMMRNYARGDEALKIMIDNPRISFVGIAQKLSLFYANGKPDTSKVSRLIRQLKDDNLVRKVRGVWVPKKAREKRAKALEIDKQSEGAEKSKK